MADPASKPDANDAGLLGMNAASIARVVQEQFGNLSLMEAAAALRLAAAMFDESHGLNERAIMYQRWRNK